MKDILQPFLDEKGCVKEFPARRKAKVYALCYIAQHLQAGKVYTEKEINCCINAITCFNDPATVRRELFSYGFLTRRQDCSEYRMVSPLPTLEQLMPQ